MSSLKINQVLSQQLQQALHGQSAQNSGRGESVRAVKKRRYDSRSVAKYVTQLQQVSKEAYDVFREQAIL